MSSQNRKMTLFGRLKSLFSDDFSTTMAKAGPLLPVGIYLIDEGGRFRYCNEVCREILGIPKDTDVTSRSIEDYYVHNELSNYIAEMVRKDGRSIYISINSKLWKNDDGEVIGREGTFTDVTTETKYLKAFERFSNGYYEVRKQRDRHVIINCNEMFAKMHGYRSKEEVIDQDDVNYFRC